MTKMGIELSPAQAALNEPNASEDEYTAKLRDKLIERLNGNLSDYLNVIRQLSNEEAVGWSFEISVMSGAHFYLTEMHNFHASELNYLLQFKEPLKVVAAEFEDEMAVEDRSSIMWKIFHEQEALQRDFGLVEDEAEDFDFGELEQKLRDRLAENFKDYKKKFSITVRMIFSKCRRRSRLFGKRISFSRRNISSRKARLIFCSNFKIRLN